ncbi:hypothetical protein [Ekhidna sp.]|uniref:hypothetical protein n=1 Tax=Ekhidna sp. TaxID=2608089 RepID=UPI003B5C51DD
MEESILSESGQTVVDQLDYNRGDESDRYEYLLESLKNQVANLYSKKDSLARMNETADSQPEKEANIGLDEEGDLGVIRPDYLRPKYLRKDYFRNHRRTIQKWLGSVLEVKDGVFTARLKDLTNKGTDEQVELGIEDVDFDDRSLIKKGANFYWTIERKVERGQISKISNIRFQRLVELDEVELDSLIDQSKEFANKIKFK